MAFKHRRFAIEITREIDPGKLDWPAPGEAGDDAGLGGNRHYEDLRGIGWREVKKVIDAERALVRQIEEAVDPQAFVEEWEEERYELVVDPLWGLDIGVAGATVAISAARCIPFTSCNAGAFGGSHLERYPLVAFMLRRQMAPIFNTVAAEAGAGLYQHEHGQVSVFGRDVVTVMNFADGLYRRRAELNSIRFRRRSRRSKSESLFE